MPRTAIHSDRAPAAIGPYSQATRAGNMVFFSGQVPLDPATGNLVEGDITAHARQAFDNLKAVCEAAGGTMDDVTMNHIFVTDWANYQAVNKVYAEYFPGDKPARYCIQCGLVKKDALIEIATVAHIGK